MIFSLLKNIPKKLTEFIDLKSYSILEIGNGRTTEIELIEKNWTK